jgi:hypothetical protein
MKIRGHRAILAAIVLLVTALPAGSQVELRFWPADQEVAAGEDGSLAVMLDDAIEVRTVELWVTYDEATVTSEGGEPGELFWASGCPLFPVFEEDPPGSWYAGSVTLGPSCYLTGPGELYRWDFRGFATGVCRVAVDSVVLYDPNAEVIDGVTLAGTKILVGDVASIEETPTGRLALSLSPNPFNPRTTIRFGGGRDECVTVEVFDLNGRCLARLWSGRLGAQPGVAQWDGTDWQGRPVAAGTYLFQIYGRDNRQGTTKGILLR